MKMPSAAVLKNEKTREVRKGEDMRRKLGMALLLDDSNFDALERMADILGEDVRAAVKSISAARKTACSYNGRCMRKTMPITELQRMEQQLKAIGQLNNDKRIEGLIRAVHMGDEVSRKGVAAILPMFMKGADPMTTMLFNMMINGGDVSKIMGSMAGGDIIGSIMKMAEAGGNN